MDNFLEIYGIGCASAFALHLVRAALSLFWNWITKVNVVRNNLAKLEKPNTDSIWKKLLVWTAYAVAETLCSWISVILVAYQTIIFPFKVIREALSYTPDQLKLLRFPLYNNPGMSPELVWAHAIACAAISGVDMTQYTWSAWHNDHLELTDNLAEIKLHYPDFWEKKAIDHLISLDVLDADLIEKLLLSLPESEIEGDK